jgi:dTDP-4-dehydrorhamnose reductase
MRILVTGAAGQLGVDLVQVLRAAGHTVAACDRAEMDITDLCAVRERMLFSAPDAVVHCAAYTAVDRAETDAEQAFRVNAYGTRNVAVAAAEVNAKLVYISTDYVFDGDTEAARTEFDLVRPLNVYGRSKLAGEQFVRELHTRFFIVRTAWVYGMHGNNFVYTMLRLGAERGDVKVVADQVGSPTYTVDLADTIARLLPTSLYGTYHVTGGGSCSWYEFAQAIFAEAAALRGKVIPLSAPSRADQTSPADDAPTTAPAPATPPTTAPTPAPRAHINPALSTPTPAPPTPVPPMSTAPTPSAYASVIVTPCTTAAFPQAATRPAYSVLDAQGLRLSGLPPMRHWRDALHAFFAEVTISPEDSGSTNS